MTDGKLERAHNFCQGQRAQVHILFSSSNVLAYIADGTCVSESFTNSRRTVYTCRGITWPSLFESPNDDAFANCIPVEYVEQ